MKLDESGALALEDRPQCVTPHIGCHVHAEPKHDVDTSVADADRDRTGYEHDDFLDVTSVVDPDISHIADAHLKTESQVLPNDPNLFIRGHVYPV